ncbi:MULTISPECIES: hypothetical protein [unclassified Streptomyces]|uniref:hypothetical protein n=1 Tax=unclassified Streptomyces TaxID=2593676 RepID=UPI00036E3A55|nr:MULTISPECIES: hypothetical protein [unclassified Streptomyces]MYT34086.1 hypothetical protein [Streptomyces sp. SID8354]
MTSASTQPPAPRPAPAGRTANLGQVKGDGARTAQFKRLCADCPLRGRCTLDLRRLINLGLAQTGTTWHLTPATA